MKIIGLVGRLAAGKGYVANLLSEQFNAHVVTLSNILRQVASQAGEPNPNRQYLQDLGDRLRQEQGAQVLVQIAIDISVGYDFLVIEGIRNTAEVDCVKKHYGDIIAVTADREVRFNRLLQRARSDDPKTWEEFLVMEEKDLHGEHKHGQRVADCLELASFTITNNGDEISIHQELERYVKGKEL